MQSVERAIDLVTYVVTQLHSPSLAEMSQDLVLNKSTVHRLLSCLRSKGVLERDSSNRYRAGALVFQWGSSVLREGGLVSVILPHLQQLGDESGETASFHLVAGWNHVCIEQVVSPHPLRYVMVVGQAIPLQITSPGKAILAHLPASEIESVLGSPDTAKILHVDIQTLRSELSTIKEHGVAFSFGEWEKGASGAAAPVFSNAGRVIGAVTISGPDGRLNLTALQVNSQRVKKAADRISWELGYRPGKPVSSTNGRKRRTIAKRSDG